MHYYIHIVDANTSKIFTRTSRCASTLKPYLFNDGPENPGREQNAQQIRVNRPATSILNARFIVWRQTPARYNWPLIRVRQKVNSSFVRPTSSPPLLSLSHSLSLAPFRSLPCSPLLYPRPIKSLCPATSLSKELRLLQLFVIFESFHSQRSFDFNRTGRVIDI